MLVEISVIINIAAILKISNCSAIEQKRLIVAEIVKLKRRDIFDIMPFLQYAYFYKKSIF